jgi:hypothetical protein
VSRSVEHMHIKLHRRSPLTDRCRRECITNLHVLKKKSGCSGLSFTVKRPRNKFSGIFVDNAFVPGHIFVVEERQFSCNINNSSARKEIVGNIVIENGMVTRAAQPSERIPKQNKH